MISRRLVRIKTLQGLYAWQQMGEASVQKGKTELTNDLLITFDVYLFILEFPLHFRQFLDSEKAAEKSKYYPDKIKIRDCGLMQHSELVTSLYNAALNHPRKYFKFEWANAADQFEDLFAELRDQDFVRDYLVFDHPDVEQDKLFLEELYHYLINACELFYGIIEEAYSYWNEDEVLILKEIQKTVNSATKDAQVKLAQKLTLVHEDVVFGQKLFEMVAEKGADFEKLVEDVTDNWDPSRIAILDLFAIKMAVAEYTSFPEIPVKVTINEYLDIIKDYSTPGSSRFLNGVLDKLRKKLEEQGHIQKTGRGLRER
jgi:N utilization substance protein B